MSCIAPTAFWLAVCGATCLTFGFVLPCWLGRRHGDDSVTMWGLWYRMDCGRGNCSTQFQVLDSDAVSTIDDWTLDLAVIPALATVAFVVGHVGMTLLELLTCRCCCRPNCNPRRLVIVVTWCALLAGMFAVLAVIMAVIVYDDFYDGNSINHPEEFPWSAFLYGVGAIFFIIAAIFYFIIMCNWDQHSDYFGYSKYRHSDSADGPVAGSLYKYNRTDSFKTQQLTDKNRTSGGSFKNWMKSSSRGSRRSKAVSLKRDDKDTERSSIKRSARPNLERSRSYEDSPQLTPTGFINSAYSSDSLERGSYFNYRIGSDKSDSVFKRSDSEMNIRHSSRSMHEPPKSVTRSLSNLNVIDLENSRKDRIDYILNSIRETSELRKADDRNSNSNSKRLRDSKTHSYELSEFSNSGKSENPLKESGKSKLDNFLRSTRTSQGSRKSNRLRDSSKRNYSLEYLQNSKRDESAFSDDSNIILRSSASELSFRREGEVPLAPMNRRVLDILARESMH